MKEYFMGIVIYVLLIALGFRYPKSKTVTRAIVVFMLFVFSFVERDGDYQQYKYVYEIFDNNWLNVYEPGFVFIIWICNKMGLSYSFFRLVVGSIFTSGLYRAIRTQTEGIAFSFALVLLFPFFVFVATIRSAVAMGFILNAIPFLMDKSLRGSIKYIEMILLASLFHVSSLIFLAFLLVRFKITKRNVIIYTFFSALCGVILHSSSLISKLMSQITQNQKILQWFTNNESSANFVGSLVVLIIFIALAFVAHYAACLCNYSEKTYLCNGKYSALIANLSVLILFAYPLFIFSTVFMRQLYMFLPCVIISCVNAIIQAYEKYSIKQLAILGKKLRISATAHVDLQVFFIVGLVLLCAFYYDLPYLKQGQSMFDALYSFTIIW